MGHNGTHWKLRNIMGHSRDWIRYLGLRDIEHVGDHLMIMGHSQTQHTRGAGHNHDNGTYWTRDWGTYFDYRILGLCWIPGIAWLSEKMGAHNSNSPFGSGKMANCKLCAKRQIDQDPSGSVGKQLKTRILLADIRNITDWTSELQGLIPASLQSKPNGETKLPG